MTIYQRISMVNAVQFSEDEFLKNSLMYPDVFDRGMVVAAWKGKTALDGR